jgi:hypothetical protein
VFGVTFLTAMKMFSAKAKIDGLTLIELLVMICVTAVLAAMLLPATTHGGPAYRTRCLSHLRQINIGFILYSGDYGGKFPMQVSAQNGGTMEFIYSDHIFPHFKKLRKYVNEPQLFKCWSAPVTKPDKRLQIMKR